jgi:CBS domain containing-hemolysin-like protein
VAFGGITEAHLVLGGQGPKIYALRRPENVLPWCALPLKFFSYLSYPFMPALNASTSFLLRKLGIENAPAHETVHSEDEIRALLSMSHQAREFSRCLRRIFNDKNR